MKKNGENDKMTNVLPPRKSYSKYRTRVETRNQAPTGYEPDKLLEYTTHAICPVRSWLLIGY